MKLKEMDRDICKKKVEELTEIFESFDTEHRTKLVRVLQLSGLIYEELSIPELLCGIVEKRYNIDSLDIDFRSQLKTESMSRDSGKVRVVNR